MRVMIARLLPALAALALPAASLTQEPEPASPSEIVAAAEPEEWVAIAPEDLLLMDLAPDRDGNPRRVIIQLMPPPFSQGWVENIRTLARTGWYDGLSINRVQDNYVVQWGDPDGENPTNAKPLPNELGMTEDFEYELQIGGEIEAALRRKVEDERAQLEAAFERPTGNQKVRAIMRAIPRDPYSDETLAFRGFPIAVDREAITAWPVHCYAMVGVGRDLPPDTGTGAELYAVIGHAPRHLDRNIALVGRVIEGIEHLSSLPRGTGELGFYETAEERVPIRSVRLGNTLPESERQRFEYLSTESETFARYLEARANRRDAFFIRPAGGVDICNAPVPIRRVAAE